MVNNAQIVKLCDAAQLGNFDIVKELLPHIENINAKNGWGDNALHLAALVGHIEIVRILLGVLNVDVAQTDNFGGTALHNASRKGHVEIVKELLPHIEDVNAKDVRGENALHLATLVGHIEIVRILLGVPNVDVVQTDSYGDTALHNASMRGHVEIVKELLPHIEDVNAKNALGENALHLAASGGHIEIVRILLGVPNVDVAQRDNSSNTALHLASMRGHVEIVKELLPHIEDVNAKNGRGDNALHFATWCGYIEIVRILLDFPNIDVNATNNNGYTFIELAVDCGFDRIEALFINSEAGKRYMDNLYRDRQVYVDAANAILVGAALIASVTFASWLQPPLNYTLSGDSYSTGDPYPSSNYPKYADVEHNIGLGVFWVFNSLSFYFAISTVVLGACSVLPRGRFLFTRDVVKLKRNLLWTSSLLAISVFFVLVAFGTAGILVLMPSLKFRSYMIVPTAIGGIVCMINLVYLALNIWTVSRGERNQNVMPRVF